MKIFVYGSLKKGKKLSYYLKNAKFLGEAITCKPYPLILSKSKWYPYLLEKNDGFKIKGEVYEIDFKTLKKLDRLEEAPFYYYRRKICVILNNKKTKSWCYFKRKPIKYKKRDLLREF
ncbi:gamma-glutamylcyclotransferase [Caminibacter mediatlanticus TB-2]|uniref:Gamma-glutamylcyclotransferase family protein n=1 Tax=Caminibacter mediatlanticus TB-2 TaxID=391592 RepID=A0AAI9F1P4_9BACT|nr:gamma-glutamylcyclotransferase family protein [Caminibacter mediatlanticus]EDM22925.1 hypothetical protein CMTB2_07795 [Caminibacter mediatlanticus TB-2]QCT94494.1 gamma-glutamylcyclotransferase [Caminibacter mediatlanticus TB-2]